MLAVDIRMIREAVCLGRMKPIVHHQDAVTISFSLLPTNPLRIKTRIVLQFLAQAAPVMIVILDLFGKSRCDLCPGLATAQSTLWKIVSRMYLSGWPSMAC